MRNKTRKHIWPGVAGDVDSHHWCVGRISCADVEQSRAPPWRTAVLRTTTRHCATVPLEQIAERDAHDASALLR